ncbi:MAG: hypothetical protein EKK32_26875, partial [Bradyrhizobiaceae bacterium]
LAMTMSRHAPSFPRHETPEVCISLSPSFKARAQGMPGCWPQPMARLQQKKQAAVTTGPAVNRHSLRDGLTSYAYSPRGSAVLPP